MHSQPKHTVDPGGGDPTQHPLPKRLFCRRKRLEMRQASRDIQRFARLIIGMILDHNAPGAQRQLAAGNLCLSIDYIADDARRRIGLTEFCPLSKEDGESAAMRSE